MLACVNARAGTAGGVLSILRSIHVQFSLGAAVGEAMRSNEKSRGNSEQLLGAAEPWVGTRYSRVAQIILSPGL